MSTVEELEQQLKVITENVQKELTALRMQSIQNNTRLEAVIRMMVQKSIFNFDDFIDFIDAYIAFSTKVNELNKLDTIADKLKGAAEFNTTSIVPIHVDDLNILPAVKSTGGLSKTLQVAVANLPSTNRFKAAMSEILREEDPVAAGEVTN